MAFLRDRRRSSRMSLRVALTNTRLIMTMALLVQEQVRCAFPPSLSCADVVDPELLTSDSDPLYRPR